MQWYLPKSIFKECLEDTYCIFRILLKSILHNTGLIVLEHEYSQQVHIRTTVL